MACSIPGTVIAKTFPLGVSACKDGRRHGAVVARNAPISFSIENNLLQLHVLVSNELASARVLVRYIFAFDDNDTSNI